MTEVSKLISGFRVFKSTTYVQKKDIIHHLLQQGQKPSTLVISCCDLRISPSEIFATSPGELYVINNIGGLVPKYDTTGTHGILSAIEYAVQDLEVENIIILGHAKCDGIKMLISDQAINHNKNLSPSMHAWLDVAKDAKDAVQKELADKTIEEQQESCEYESLVISLKNLINYPYIKKRLSQKKINVCAWHFNIESGSIMTFDPNSGFFEPVN